MTREQIRVIQLVANAIIETVAEAGTLGAPSGIVFAALSAHGLSLHQYVQIISGLKSAGYLTEEFDCLHATGKQFKVAA